MNWGKMPFGPIFPFVPHFPLPPPYLIFSNSGGGIRDPLLKTPQCINCFLW